MKIEIREQVPLAPLTSWQIGGVADYFCTPKNIEEIKEAQNWAQEFRHSITVLGGGSNVLVSDQGVRGLTICLKYFSKMQAEVISMMKPDNSKESFLSIRAHSGTSKSELLKIFLKHKLPPALMLAGLPGDIGGGVVMNAGVAENFQPREFVEMVDWIEVLKPDQTIHRYKKSDLDWSYRHCRGWQPGLIVEVGLSWPMVPDLQILEKVKEANRIRLSKQPLDMPSCGSVFVNPEGHKAAQLIDSCGLKGRRVGEAQVSLKHANFIVNLGHASAKDTWQLMTEVQEIVLQKTGVQLKTEVELLGEWGF